MQVRGGWSCRRPHVPPLLVCPVSRLGNKASLFRPNAVTQRFFLSRPPVYFSAGSGPRILPVKSPFRDQKLSCCPPHCPCPCPSAQGCLLLAALNRVSKGPL